MAQQKRKRNLSLHYATITLIVLAIFTILSVTVFFNINTARVSGSSIYSAEEIIAAGGIEGGDNMIRKNMGKAEDAITSELIYIETAEITRKLPSSVEITVTPCVETASLEGEDGYLIVSGTGKILRYSDSPAEGTRIFYGAEPAGGLAPGMTFASEDENKTDVIFELMSKGADPFAEKITSYDVTDRLNISCMYDDRIDVRIGLITDIDYKFKLAGQVMEKLSPDAEGRLKLFDKAGQFLSSADLSQLDQVYEHNTQEDIFEPDTDPEPADNDEPEQSGGVNFE